MSSPTIENPAADVPVATATKRAFAYLRVSSEGQVNTGYSRDGLSIDAQREEADAKASQLDAEITRFFLDPGRSAFVDLHKRTDFLNMLAELKRCNEHQATRIDYVIIWASDRWARNTVDHFQTHDLVKAAGARLVSITEPMLGDDTPEAFYFEGMKAVNNQYESMRTSRRVKLGIHQKAKEGGSYGGFRLGYIKGSKQLPDGRRVSGVEPDPRRGHFITTAFQLYDSGEYSISQLVDELYRLGLRSYPTRRYVEGKVGTSAIQRLLRNPFYAGWIVYKRGTPDEQIFAGRHEPLVDQDIFDRVQQRLDDERTGGERPQRHRHYLKGSVYCGDCGQRLSYGISRNKLGNPYAYFFCSARINGTRCAQRTNMRPELIEQAIERYYRERPVQLTATAVAKRTNAIEALVAVSQQAVVQVKTVKTALIAKLKAQQVRLIRLHSEEGDDVSPDAFREERQRMSAEIRAAEKSLAETEQRLRLDADMLRMALELAEDVATVYETSDEQTKRGYNQAFFKRLFITPEWDEATGQTSARVSQAELTEPYATLLASDLVPSLTQEVERILAARQTEDGSQEPSSTAGCSSFVKLAEREGFEPSNEVSPVTRFPVAPVQPLRHLSWRSPGPTRHRDGLLKATTPTPGPLLGSRADASTRQRSRQQGRGPDRHLRRHRRSRQHHHRLHRRAGPRRAAPERRIHRRAAPERRQRLLTRPARGVEFKRCRRASRPAFSRTGR
jgi:site-specific DNA recombinase